jgi:hypothetical protein
MTTELKYVFWKEFCALTEGKSEVKTGQTNVNEIIKFS